MSGRTKLTSEELEQIRTHKIMENMAIISENEQRINQRGEEIKALLDANQGQIAGVVFLVVAKEGSALIDPNSTGGNAAADGMTLYSQLHDGYGHTMLAHLRGIIQEREQSRNPLAALFGRD